MIELNLVGQQISELKALKQEQESVVLSETNPLLESSGPLSSWDPRKGDEQLEQVAIKMLVQLVLNLGIEPFL
jgi:hypothetical protein